MRRPTRTGQAGRGRASLRRVRRIRVLGFTRAGNFSRDARGSPGSSGAAKSRARCARLDFACVLMRSSSGRTANIACTTVRSTFDAVAAGDAICSNPRCARHGGENPSPPQDRLCKNYPRDFNKELNSDQFEERRSKPRTAVDDEAAVGSTGIYQTEPAYP